MTITGFTNRRDFGLGSRRQLVPIGTVLDFAGSTSPDGYLLCDGSVVRQEDYTNLFKVIGTTYNTGGEAGYQFRLPDLRGRVAAGKDNMGGTTASRLTATSGLTGTTLGATGGNELLQSHNHGVTDPTHVHGTGNGQGFGTHIAGTANDAPGAGAPTLTGVINTTAAAATGITIQSNGSGSSQNVQPTLILNKIIKT